MTPSSEMKRLEVMDPMIVSRVVVDTDSRRPHPYVVRTRGDSTTRDEHFSACCGTAGVLTEQVLADDVHLDGLLPGVAGPVQSGRVLADAAAGDGVVLVVERLLRALVVVEDLL